MELLTDLYGEDDGLQTTKYFADVLQNMQWIFILTWQRNG